MKRIRHWPPCSAERHDTHQFTSPVARDGRRGLILPGVPRPSLLSITPTSHFPVPGRDLNPRVPADSRASGVSRPPIAQRAVSPACAQPGGISASGDCRAAAKWQHDHDSTGMVSSDAWKEIPNGAVAKLD